MGDRDSPIVVNSEKQLFIDEKFIAKSDGVTLTMNPPQQMPEPVLGVDRPWEGGHRCLQYRVEGRRSISALV